MRKHTKRKVWPLRDPISHAMSGIQVAVEHSNIKTYMAASHASMKALVEGKAKRIDLQHITMAHNMVCALMKQGFGEPHAEDMEASAAALDSIARRAREKGRILGAGPELNALNFMLQIHDAMMDVISVSEYNAAVMHSTKVVNSGRSQELNLTGIREEEHV